MCKEACAQHPGVDVGREQGIRKTAANLPVPSVSPDDPREIPVDPLLKIGIVLI
jgi:hypothetical protein